MRVEFEAVTSPSKELCRDVAGLAPWNPYYSPQYLEAKRSLGMQPSMLTLRENERVVSGCPAFIENGLLSRSLEIESLPQLVDEEAFWKGLESYCKTHGISELGVHTAASLPSAIPALRGELWRNPRSEYVLDLRDTDLRKQLRNSHRGRVNRSTKAGVAVQRAEGTDAWREHSQAVQSSMARRKARGEDVGEVKQARLVEALLRNEGGELFQAVLDGKVLSSAFVIKAQRGAYYFWAGTTSEGMSLGASHFLVHEISRTLQAQAMEVFNLGGTDPDNKGLVEFKRGFGAREVSLESAEFCLGSKVKRQLGRAVEMLRRDPQRLIQRGRERISRLLPARQS